MKDDKSFIEISEVIDSLQEIKKRTNIFIDEHSAYKRKNSKLRTEET